MEPREPKKPTDLRLKRGAKTKKAILRTALEILGTQGKKGVTTRALMKKAKVSKGTLYHHFENTDQILFEAMGLMIEQILSGISQSAHGNVKDYLEGMGLASLEATQKEKKIFRAFFSLIEKGLFDPHYRKYLNQLYESLFNAAHKNLLQSLKTRPPEKRLLTATLASCVLVDGMCLYAMFLPHTRNLETMWSQLSPLLAAFVEGDPKLFERSLQ